MKYIAAIVFVSLHGTFAENMKQIAKALIIRTCLERAPHGPQKCGLSRQVVSMTGSVILKCRSFCKKCVSSVKTGGLLWQWSLMTGSLY